ncbi:hypothetical protein LLG96_19490 [bacterium]|nr:hypothetical protein [bacterium]
MKRTAFIGAVFLAVLAAGCIFDNEKNNPTVPQQDHYKADGIVLIDSGVRFFRMFRGEIDTTNGKVDTLVVPVGLTPHWEIKFLDENNQEIEPPDDANKSFGWVISDPSVVEVYRHDGQEWEFHLNGLKVGETTIEFRVMHNDHYDFHTPSIPVSVRNLDGSNGPPVGVRLYEEDSGVLLASASLFSEGETAGEILVPLGSKTGHIEAVFYDDQNREFTPQVPPHALRLIAGDESLLGTESAPAPEYWSFHLIGIKEGETTLQVVILHDGNVGKEFTPIRVHIGEYDTSGDHSH